MKSATMFFDVCYDEFNLPNFNSTFVDQLVSSEANDRVMEYNSSESVIYSLNSPPSFTSSDSNTTSPCLTDTTQFASSFFRNQLPKGSDTYYNAMFLEDMISTVPDDTLQQYEQSCVGHCPQFTRVEYSTTDSSYSVSTLEQSSNMEFYESSFPCQTFGEETSADFPTGCFIPSFSPTQYSVTSDASTSSSSVNNEDHKSLVIPRYFDEEMNENVPKFQSETSQNECPTNILIPESILLNSITVKANSTGKQLHQQQSLSFECSKCQKRFPFKSQLEEHHMYRHSNDRSHTCPMKGCEKMFKTKSNLNQHIKTHWNLKIVCDICKKYFTLNGFRYHAKKHGLTLSTKPIKGFKMKQISNSSSAAGEESDDRQHLICDKCPKKEDERGEKMKPIRTYPNKAMLSKHISRCHNNLTFHCLHCESSSHSFKSFKRKEHLYRHMRQAHGNIVQS